MLYPGHRFVKSRPDFLRHPETGRCLELDLYCEELKIAVEYNGRQHYEYTPHFHTSPLDLHDQMQRDQLKLKLCRKHGIKLIVVPYTVTDIHEFLKRKLKST
jgi:hypothetical protein